jgi:hypothetical protein
MDGNEMTIRETTQPMISGHLVGVGNIWERDLPDDRGVIAPRLSATLSIMDLATNQTRHEIVFTGSLLSLGDDTYCVVNVEEGKSELGEIILRKNP